MAKEEIKVCKITSESNAWVMRVDGYCIPFSYNGNAEYFAELYAKIGYTVIVD